MKNTALIDNFGFFRIGSVADDLAPVPNQNARKSVVYTLKTVAITGVL
jgi:hypothetical protein